MITGTVKLPDTAQTTETANFYVSDAYHTFETAPASVGEMQERIN